MRKCHLSSPLMFSMGLAKAVVEGLIVNPLLSPPKQIKNKSELPTGQLTILDTKFYSGN